MSKAFIIHLIFLITSCTTTAADQPNLQYLSGFQRLSGTNYTDFYFCCNVVGEFLQWQFNDEPLTGFRVGEAGRVVVDTRSTFNYTATLLSSEPLDNHQAKLDSLLIVSFYGEHPRTFDVTCSSLVGFMTVTAESVTSDVIGSNAKGGIVLNHVLSREIVQNRNKTHVFVCEVPDMLQFFSISGTPIGFTDHDHIGQDRTVLSDDWNTVELQGVLIARQPFQSISFLFVTTEESEVTVTCSYESHQVQLSSLTLSTTEPSSTNATEVISPESYTRGM